MTTSIVVVGATGHVGAALCARAITSDSHCLAGAFASESSVGASLAGHPTFAVNNAVTTPVDVVIDFSTDAGCQHAVRLALQHSAALVVGTTAISDQTHQQINDASSRIATLVASNTSLGANLLAALAARASDALGKSYDVSIVEAHRKNKRDAPSGTARTIARVIRQHGGQLSDEQILSVRSGDIVGEHTVQFVADGEIIELTHRALNRDVFAAGALRAADWIAGRSAGQYHMMDVLGLTD